MLRLPATNEIPPAAIPRSVGDRQGTGMPGAGGRRGEAFAEGPRNRGDMGSGASDLSDAAVSLFLLASASFECFLAVSSVFGGLVAIGKVVLAKPTSMLHTAAELFLVAGSSGLLTLDKIDARVWLLHANRDNNCVMTAK